MEKEIDRCGREMSRLFRIMEVKEDEYYRFYKPYPWWRETVERRTELNELLDELNDWRRQEYELKEEREHELQLQAKVEVEFRAEMERLNQQLRAWEQKRAVEEEERQKEAVKAEMQQEEAAKASAARGAKEFNERWESDQTLYAIRNLFVAMPYNNGYERFVGGIDNLFQDQEAVASELVLCKAQILGSTCVDDDARNLFDEMPKMKMLSKIEVISLLLSWDSLNCAERYPKIIMNEIRIRLFYKVKWAKDSGMCNFDVLTKIKEGIAVWKCESDAYSINNSILVYDVDWSHKEYVRIIFIFSGGEGDNIEECEFVSSNVLMLAPEVLPDKLKLVYEIKSWGRSQGSESDWHWFYLGSNYEQNVFFKFKQVDTARHYCRRSWIGEFDSAEIWKIIEYVSAQEKSLCYDPEAPLGLLRKLFKVLKTLIITASSEYVGYYDMVTGNWKEVGMRNSISKLLAMVSKKGGNRGTQIKWVTGSATCFLASVLLISNLPYNLMWNEATSVMKLFGRSTKESKENSEVSSAYKNGASGACKINIAWVQFHIASRARGLTVGKRLTGQEIIMVPGPTTIARRLYSQSHSLEDKRWAGDDEEFCGESLCNIIDLFLQLIWNPGIEICAVHYEFPKAGHELQSYNLEVKVDKGRGNYVWMKAMLDKVGFPWPVGDPKHRKGEAALMSKQISDSVHLDRTTGWQYDVAYAVQGCNGKHVLLGYGGWKSTSEAGSRIQYRWVPTVETQRYQTYATELVSCWINKLLKHDVTNWSQDANENGKSNDIKYTMDSLLLSGAKENHMALRSEYMCGLVTDVLFWSLKEELNSIVQRVWNPGISSEVRFTILDYKASMPCYAVASVDVCLTGKSVNEQNSDKERSYFRA